MKREKQQAAKVTVSGIITKSPQRVRTATGKVMATMIIQAESERRSPYPLALVAYDDDALMLMACQKGSRVIATGRHEWFNEYQLTGAQIVTC